MKIIRHFVFHMLCFILIAGCDLQTYLTINNSTGGRVVYNYEIRELNEKIKEVKINVPYDQEKNNEVNIITGFGKRWTNQRIKEYTDKLNYIKIGTKIDTVFFFEKDSIIKLLKDNRTGLLKNEIKIKVK